jgi:chemotaxis signal transduction protein
LAVPAEKTERIIPVTRVQTELYETENQEAFISLPALFKLKDAAPHGLVLKTKNANRTVLLTPKIDIDLEIPEEEVRQLPQAFSGLYQYFTGAYFYDQDVVLILNVEKLTEGMG